MATTGTSYVNVIFPNKEYVHKKAKDPYPLHSLKYTKIWQSFFFKMKVSKTILKLNTNISQFLISKLKNNNKIILSLQMWEL